MIELASTESSPEDRSVQIADQLRSEDVDFRRVERIRLAVKTPDAAADG